MPLIYVTGPSGAGKSTVRKELQTRGYEAHDTDEDGMSAWHNIETGEKVRRPSEAERSEDWYKHHAYRMSPDRVKELAERAKDKLVFLCGIPSNDLELAEYYDKVICLVIDEEVMKQRIASRETNNFGKAADELELMLYWHGKMLDRYEKFGAIMIDATKPLHEVVDEIIKVSTTTADGSTFANTELAKKIAEKTYPSATKIETIERGYDNIVVLVDDSYALRFPRNKDAYARSQYEKQALQHLEMLETISVPRILGEHANPPYLLTSFVKGEHLSPSDISSFPLELQQELGEDIATFAYTMHKAFSVEEARQAREDLRLDEGAEEPWNVFFERLLAGSTPLTSEQDEVAKEYHKKWKRSNADSPLVVVHDDLHTENMLFRGQHLCGIIDFGDTNIGTAEQDLRQLYRLNEAVLNAAADKYSELSGRQLNVEVAKIWAIMQELAVYTEQLLAKNTSRPSFVRAAKNLNTWLRTDTWGKGLISLSETSSYQ